MRKVGTDFLLEEIPHNTITSFNVLLLCFLSETDELFSSSHLAITSFEYLSVGENCVIATKKND